jgi:N-acyl homoserine lactone hydrolase
VRSMWNLSGRPRLYAFQYGWEPVPEAVSLRGGSRDRVVVEPVTGAAVAYDDGWILIDTGLDPEILTDPELRQAHYGDKPLPWVTSPEPLLQQIEAAGLSLATLRACCLSHLHCDHGGGLRLLATGTPIVLQAREHTFATTEAGVEHAYFRRDYTSRELAWLPIEGEVEIAPGLVALPTFGHTPGHQSFRIELDGRSVVLACDAADLRRNIDERIPPGETTHPQLATEAEHSIERLHELDRTPGVEVWPGHDPEFWGTRKGPPFAYR